VTSREFHERLRRRARRAGLQVGPEVAQALEAYVRLLARWNARINLTALPVEEPGDETMDRLIVEPLVAARHLPGPDAVVIDIGSGGGSPAIPMKLATPGLRLRMVESKTRKSAFLLEAIRHLALADTAVETVRFEELLARPDLHDAHDVATLRAVRVESRVLMNLQAFLKPGGRLFLFRGPSASEERTVVHPPLAWEATYPIGDLFSSRLVVVRKTAPGA